jgi:hypothetical protein
MHVSGLPALLSFCLLNSLVDFMCWRPWPGLLGTVWVAPSWVAFLLLVLPLTIYRESSWCLRMVACLPISLVVPLSSSCIRVGCVVLFVVRGRTGIGRSRLCWWRLGRPGGRSCRCASGWSLSWWLGASPGACRVSLFLAVPRGCIALCRARGGPSGPVSVYFPRSLYFQTPTDMTSCISRGYPLSRPSPYRSLLSPACRH